MSLRVFLDRMIFSICSLILCVMVLDVSWQVFSRYVLNDPSSFSDEVARFLMIWLALLGGAYLFGARGHLAVTMLIDRFSPNLKLLVILLSYVLVIVFAGFTLIYGGYNLVLRTIKQVSPAVQIPMGYVYLILPISGVLIILYVVLNLLDLKQTIRANQSSETEQEVNQ